MVCWVSCVPTNSGRSNRFIESQVNVKLSYSIQEGLGLGQVVTRIFSLENLQTTLRRTVPLTEHYRKLEYLGISMDVQRVEYHHETDTEDGWFGQYGREGPLDWNRMASENVRRKYRASYEIWVAFHLVKGIYINCGWDVDATEQRKFRREEFVERRAKHWAEVVEPLHRAEHLLSDEINWKEMRNGDYGGWTYSYSRAADIFDQRKCLEQRPGGEGSLLSEARSEAHW